MNQKINQSMEDNKRYLDERLGQEKISMSFPVGLRWAEKKRISILLTDSVRMK